MEFARKHLVIFLEFIFYNKFLMLEIFSEKVKQKNAMTGPLSRKIPKLVERVKKLSGASMSFQFNFKAIN